MKFKNTIIFLFVLTLGLCFVSFTVVNLDKGNAAKEMPGDVKAAIDKSCFGCHNTDAGNAKSKEKLDFKTLDGLSKAARLAKLRGISETIKKGEMPPKGFLERFPDKKLTPEEAKSVTKWADAEVKKLLKK
jgi:hypothetical protein